MDLVTKYLDDHKIDFNMVTESVIAICTMIHFLKY